MNCVLLLTHFIKLQYLEYIRSKDLCVKFFQNTLTQLTNTNEDGHYFHSLLSANWQRQAVEKEK